MRHGKRFNHLKRTASHRKAMLANMASSLILHKRIETTVAKAKALRKYVEPLLTKAKTDTTHSRRIVFSYLQNKEVIKELFGEVAEKIAKRPGGYTRIIRLGNRLGDNAEICMIELVDFNETLLQQTEQDSKPKRRRRRKKKSGGEGQTEAQTSTTETSTVDEVADDTSSEEENLAAVADDMDYSATDDVEESTEDNTEEDNNSEKTEDNNPEETE